jgi:hypothetical protein
MKLADRIRRGEAAIARAKAEGKDVTQWEAHLETLKASYLCCFNCESTNLTPVTDIYGRTWLACLNCAVGDGTKWPHGIQGAWNKFQEEKKTSPAAIRARKGENRETTTRTVDGIYRQPNMNANQNTKEKKVKTQDAFPSKYLKVIDLRGQHVAVTINSVDFEQVGDDEKPVVYFKNKQKGLVLNKTNWEMIAEIAGSDESDDWPGTRIVLYPDRVPFKGKHVDAIRIDKPHKPSAKKSSPQDDDEPPPEDEELVDESGNPF